MHIVFRPSMLALTVDRLVGTPHSPHHQLPLSPAASDSGRSVGSSSSPTPSKPTASPSHFSKITLLLSKNSPPTTSHSNSHPVMTSSDERPAAVTGEAGESPVKVKLESERCSSSSPSLHDPPCRLCPSPHDSSDEDEQHSSSSRSPRLVDEHSCRSDSPLRQNPSSPSLTSPPSQHSLKFSIHDILRPDFGQRALQRPAHPSYLSSPVQRPHPYKRSRHSSGLSEPRRPSSVKTHSEDSNSSSTSRSTAREEVVDEAKVNPAVPKGPLLWPAWVYCTRYSDRPSSGPRSRRIVRTKGEERRAPSQHEGDEKRPRTAFTAEQLGKLKREFDENRYLTEKRRQDLARDLKLHENQIKIWFQNKRAKLKKSSGQRGGLALQLMAQGLYNHSTVGVDEEEDYLPC